VKMVGGEGKSLENVERLGTSSEEAAGEKPKETFPSSL